MAGEKRGHQNVCEEDVESVGKRSSGLCVCCKKKKNILLDSEQTFLWDQKDVYHTNDVIAHRQ